MWQASESLSPSTHSPAAGFAAVGLEQTLLLRVMDEIDYGMLVIDGRGCLRHANHQARHEMASGRLIMVHGNVLLGTTTGFTEQIQAALEQALRGQRRLLMLEQDDKELSMAFIPLSHPLEADAPSVLVLLSRRSACENLAVRLYARAQNLSPAEESVMMALCRGLSIPDIAKAHGVAQSTVRSQIKALREKTSCSSIRRLLQRINSLPPVVPALRIISPVPHNAMAFAQP